MKPYYLYFLEFCFRFCYILISCLLCWFIFFENINTLFLFETNSLLSILSNNRLIVTKISQFFSTVWFVSIFFSTIFIFPLTVYHVKSFLVVGWHKYQILIFNKFCSFFFKIFSIFYLLSYIFIIVNLLKFFLYWEIHDIYALLRIESELSLFFYLLWSLQFKFTITYVFSTIFIILKVFSKFTFLLQLYKWMLKYKKLISYLFICCLFILFPPDFLFQIFLVLVSFLLLEFFHFFICIKIYTKKYNIYLKKCQL